MDEFLLINMLSELSPDLLEDEYMEKDLKRKEGPFYKRVFSTSTLKPKSLSNIAISNIDKEYEEHIEPMKATITKEEEIMAYDCKEANKLTIRIFKKKLHKIVTITSGITATLLFIIGILLLIIKKVKLNNGSMKTSLMKSTLM